MTKIAAKDIKPGMLVRNIGRVTNRIGEVLSCEPSEDQKGRFIVVYITEDGIVLTKNSTANGKLELH